MTDQEYTIIVVEDDPHLREIIKNSLTSEGWKIFAYSRADELYGAMDTLPDNVSLFWLDHYLPGGKSGMDIISALHESQKFKNIPIIVVSNMPWVGSVLSTDDVGITRYFVKAENSMAVIVTEIKKILGSGVR